MAAESPLARPHPRSADHAAAQRAVLERLGLPAAVLGALAARLHAGNAAAVHRLPESPLPGWRLEPDAAGGWLLIREPAGAAPQLWAAGDRWGWLHLAAAWDGDALREAWLRLPAAEWLEVRPRAAHHALWGAADALLHHSHAPGSASGAAVGLLPAQDYGALEALPPFDRPAALPPGAGGAVLNWLARLCVVQGRAQIAYRGPYPTPALFGSLARSFHPVPDAESALARFTQDATALAFRGALADSPVAWRPAPFSACRPAAELLVHLRDGVETAWVGRVPFRRAEGAGAALPAGERVWPVGAPQGRAWDVGLALLGRPYCTFYRLAADGAVIAAAPPEPHDAESGHGAPAATVPLDARWRAALWSWAALRAHEALAAAVAAQEPVLPAVWEALPRELAALRMGTLRIHSALAQEFRRRSAEEQASGLAMMLVSDVLSAAAPLLLRQAQAALERDRARALDVGTAPDDAAALLAAGRRVQAAAQARLERALPALAAALTAGQALPEDS